MFELLLIPFLLQTPTPPISTPTPSSTPPFCGGPTPQGWGTVTPPAGWEFACAYCQGTPQPTSTPNPGLYCGLTNGVCTDLGDYLVFDYPVQVSNPWANIGGADGPTTLRAVLLEDADLFTYLLAGGLYPDVGYFDVGGARWDVPGQYSYQGGGQARYKYTPTGIYDYEFSGDGGYHIEWVTSNGTAYSQPGFSLYVYPYANPDATPTPTPTGQANYCETLYTGPAFALTPFVLVGEPLCNMGWDDIDWDGTGGSDIPGLQICTQAFEDGHISLYNGKLQYSLSIFLFVALAAAFWRLMRTI